MGKKMEKLDFRLMAALIALRDKYRPRSKILEEVALRQGFGVLDYGCGPGSYTILAAEMVGESGKIFALDVNPLALSLVADRAAKKGLKNVETILSDCATGLPEDHIDVALLYDVFHDLKDQDDVLLELHRVLKPEGILSFSDHHMKEEAIIGGVTDMGLFKAVGKGRFTYTFLPADPGAPP